MKAATNSTSPIKERLVTLVDDMHRLLQKLQGGDLRSKGRSEEVVENVLNSPDLFSVVFEGMLNEDPVIRMRSADAVEKISSKRPELLQPFKNRLIHEVAEIEQQEVRWHVAQMFSYLDLTSKDSDQILQILLSYLEDKSRIVKAFSMQALVDMAKQDEKLRPQIIPLIQDLTTKGSPAMQSRGRKLLADLSKLNE